MRMISSLLATSVNPGGSTGNAGAQNAPLGLKRAGESFPRTFTALGGERQKSRRREIWPVRLPLFSAVCALCTTPNEDAVTFVGGGAKLG
jgi:hypothetical protein